jgi:hypothetical protein
VRRTSIMTTIKESRTATMLFVDEKPSTRRARTLSAEETSSNVLTRKAPMYARLSKRVDIVARKLSSVRRYGRDDSVQTSIAREVSQAAMRRRKSLSAGMRMSQPVRTDRCASSTADQ